MSYDENRISDLIDGGLKLKEDQEKKVEGQSVSTNDAKLPVSGSLPSDDRIVAEAIQVARKVDTEVGLLPSNNDIKMFCLGAKWMRDLAKGNDR